MILELLVLASTFGREKVNEWKAARAVREEEQRVNDIPDIWDSLTYQVQRRMAFYGHTADWTEEFAEWTKPPRHSVKISLRTIELNREFWQSGLSMREFADQHFQKVQDELERKYGCRSPYVGGWKWLYDRVTLYDREGNPTTLYDEKWYSR